VYRHGATKVYTVVRNVRGDVGALASDLAHLGTPFAMSDTLLELEGHCVASVSAALTALLPPRPLA